MDLEKNTKIRQTAWKNKYKKKQQHAAWGSGVTSGEKIFPGDSIGNAFRWAQTHTKNTHTNTQKMQIRPKLKTQTKKNWQSPDNKLEHLARAIARLQDTKVIHVADG